MFNGDGATGKTLLALQLQASTCLSTPWAGFGIEPVKSLGIYCEDDESELHRRIAAIANHFGRSLSDFDCMSLVSRVGMENLLVSFDKYDVAKPTALYDAIGIQAKDIGARLVVLDSLHDLFGGNEINRIHARQFINYLHRIALDIDGAVILCAHPSVAGMNTGTGTSGSTAWNNAVRSRLYLTRGTNDDADPDMRLLKTMKANYGPQGSEIELRWSRGVFVRDAVDTSDPYGQAELVFLACLDKFATEGRNVSASPQSASFAPKAFMRMPQAKGLTKDKLRRAMESLFSQGKIVVGEYRKANRHSVEIIKRAGA
jgi:RecA-family ATPase